MRVPSAAGSGLIDAPFAARIAVLALAAALAGCATPLHNAAQAGDVAQIQSLLAQGADIEVYNEGADKWTPLAYAAYGGHLDAVRALLDAGADPFAVTSGGTPYQIAVTWHYPDVAALLAAYASVPGIGIVSRGTDIVVAAVNAGTPAQRAGISPGDQLLAVDRAPTKGLAVRLVRAKLHAASTLTVQNPGEAAPRVVSVSAAPPPAAADDSSADASLPASGAAAPAAKPWWEK